MPRSEMQKIKGEHEKSYPPLKKTLFVFYFTMILPVTASPEAVIARTT